MKKKHIFTEKLEELEVQEKAVTRNERWKFFLRNPFQISSYGLK